MGVVEICKKGEYFANFDDGKSLKVKVKDGKVIAKKLFSGKIAKLTEEEEDAVLKGITLEAL